MDDTDLEILLLRMCPTRWQIQYDLTKNTTPVSTRALVLMLENIKNNADFDHKSQNPSKPKGAKGKCKMELSNYHIPKKACQGLLNWKLPERQEEKHCVLLCNHENNHIYGYR